MLTPRSKSAATLVAAVVVAAVPAAPAGAKTHHYPSSVTKAFNKTCASTAKDASNGKLTSKQAKQYCSAALSCIEKKLTLKQFEDTVKKMQSGAKNPNEKVLTSCEKAAVKKVKKS